jgi:pyruvate dehydrogenase E1 component alpha subunit
MTAEFLGKDAGYNRGRGGSMHIADPSTRNLGATGIVGSMFAPAVGIGLALKKRRSKDILLCFFGDGSTNEGEFHEALNMASLWNVPVVFICDNNQYGMSMAIEKVASVPCIAERVKVYNIPSVTVDGNDVLAVYDAVSLAVKNVRDGKGPQMVENLTYRWRGHSKSDRNLYRSQEEIAEWQKNDPIIRFGKVLLDAKILTPQDIEQIEQEAQDAIQKAAEAAIILPEPSPETMEEEVYAK